MKIWNDQSVLNLRPEIQLAVRVADHLFTWAGLQLEITWTTGGKHMEGSLHYKRRAFDALPPPEINHTLVGELKIILGPEYDVVTKDECFHVEWDPK